MSSLSPAVSPGSRGLARRFGAGEAALERRAAACRAALVGQYAACHAVEPWKCVVRDIVEPPPGHEERLGYDVLRRLGGGAAQGVAPHRRVVLPEQVLETLLSCRRRQFVPL